MFFVEINVVEEGGDFGRGDERALKVDAYRGGVVGVIDQIAHVFTCEILHVGRWDDEDIVDGMVESGVAPGCDVTVNPGPGKVLVRRLDTNVAVLTDIQSTEAMRKTGTGDEWIRIVKPLLSIRR